LLALPLRSCFNVVSPSTHPPLPGGATKLGHSPPRAPFFPPSGSRLFCAQSKAINVSGGLVCFLRGSFPKPPQSPPPLWATFFGLYAVTSSTASPPGYFSRGPIIPPNPREAIFPVFYLHPPDGPICCNTPALVGFAENRGQQKGACQKPTKPNLRHPPDWILGPPAVESGVIFRPGPASSRRLPAYQDAPPRRLFFDSLGDRAGGNLGWYTTVFPHPPPSKTGPASNSEGNKNPRISNFRGAYDDFFPMGLVLGTNQMGARILNQVQSKADGFQRVPVELPAGRF